MREQTAAKAQPAPDTAAPRGLLQRACACGSHAPGGGECEACKKKRLQRRETGGHTPETAPPVVHEVLRSPGQPLDAATRAFMEPRFGHDFSRVRVHTGAQAAESARAVSAHAYTVGSQIAFGAGQYAPHTPAGRRLLAHELAHVVQQGGRFDTVQRLTVGQSNHPLECQADVAAERVVAGAILERSALTPLAQSHVQRDLIDDLVEEIDQIASDAEDALDSAAQAAEDLVDSAVDTASNVVDTVTNTASEVADTASDVVNTVTDTASDVVNTVTDVASNVATWTTTVAGQEKISEASALAELFDGNVTIDNNGLVITIDEIEIFGRQEVLFSNPVPLERTFPFGFRGMPLGSVVLASALALRTKLDAQGIVHAGPGYLRNIRIVIDPFASNYSAAATFNVGLAVSDILTLSGSGVVQGYLVVVVDGVPIPIPIVSLQGGLKGVGRGSGLFNLQRGVELSYSGGLISFTNDAKLKVGVLLEADLFAFALAKIDLTDSVICNYHWPLVHWEDSKASQYDVSLGIAYNGDSASIVIKPISETPIPVTDIETALPPTRMEQRCASLEEITAELCKNGYIPRYMCERLGMPVPSLKIIDAEDDLPLDMPIPHLKPLAPEDKPPPGFCGKIYVTNPPKNPKSGLSRSEAIDMIWMKPLRFYDNPIFLDGGRYVRNAHKKLLSGRTIGVKFWPAKNAILERVKTPRGSELYYFKKALSDEGFEWDGFSADHVLDLFFNGPDDFLNLWPLDSGINSRAGRWHFCQPVWFTDPPDPTPKRRHLGSPLLERRFFVIKNIAEPPP